MFVGGARLPVRIGLARAILVNTAPDAERSQVVSTFAMFFEVGAAIGGIVLGGGRNARRAGRLFGRQPGVSVRAVVPVAGAPPVTARPSDFR